MVFQEESFASRWWPLAGKKSTCGSKRSSGVESCIEERDALELADSMEKGQMHEFTDEFIKPVRMSNRLHRYYVKRSANRFQYRLYRDHDQAFVLYADVRYETREISFFPYDPDDKESLFDPDRPVFKMTFNPSKTEWLVSHVRDGTWCSPRQAMNNKVERREEEVAFIQHSRIKIGDGVNHCLEANVARAEATADGANNPTARQNRVVDHLVTRQAVWNEDLQTLVLDFKGRDVIPSAKNFQVACEGRPGRVVCQHGKIEKNMFGLDFIYPLSISQAFAMAMSTVFWE